MSTDHQWDPPETATGVPDEEVTGVDEDCKPEGVRLEAPVLAVAAVDEVVAVPGIVYALIALSTPSAARAASAMPVVRRLSWRNATSRACILDRMMPSMGR
jgi:hypothetical protein